MAGWPDLTNTDISTHSRSIGQNLQVCISVDDMPSVLPTCRSYSISSEHIRCLALQARRHVEAWRHLGQCLTHAYQPLLTVLGLARAHLHKSRGLAPVIRRELRKGRSDGEV